ncbi:MAG: hypothetical protein ACKVP7_21785 [Hyphomicrobiaceae bacterium]
MDLTPYSWSRHLKIMLGTLAALLLIAATLVLIANPYGNLPWAPLRHVLMDDNQRFQYPAIIRSQRYDSLVIGTSTSRLLEPTQLERVFGGRFANLALNSGTPWEQWQVARLFAREIAAPKTLVVGLDHVWCTHDADEKRITARGFPDWMFDSNPWNDIAYMLNARTLEIAGRRIGHALDRVKERWPHNGYEVFVPPEHDYDLARARGHIYGTAVPPPANLRARRPAPPIPSDGFPALPWIEDLLAARGFERVVLLITPVHVAAQPKPGQPAYVREQRCKMELARIAGRHGNAIIDFRIPSPITREDSNYWDSVHYRVPIATRIVSDLAKAITSSADDPDGDWRVLRAAP